MPQPDVKGQWSQDRHPEVLRKIYHRFQDRIPEGAIRPKGSLCEDYKQKIAGCLGGSLDGDGVLSRYFPKQSIECASKNHPVLKNILQYLKNDSVSYSPTIIIG